MVFLSIKVYRRLALLALMPDAGSCHEFELLGIIHIFMIEVRGYVIAVEEPRRLVEFDAFTNGPRLQFLLLQLFLFFHKFLLYSLQVLFLAFTRPIISFLLLLGLRCAIRCSSALGSCLALLFIKSRIIVLLGLLGL